MPSTTLSILLLVLYVLLLIGLGLYNRKNTTSESYFLADRNLPAWLLSITFIASWWGGGSAIDLVDHAFVNGLSSFWVYGVPVLIATGMMFLFSKAIRKIGTISQPQLMEERYNATVAFLLTIFIVIFMVIGAAVQVIVVARFFHTFYDMSYEMGAVIGTAIVLLYSLFGGFKGVVLTDLLQFIFFLITGIFLCYLMYDQSGGLASVQEHAIANGQSGYTSFFNGVSDHLAYVITFGTSWMIQANIWQRISAARHPTDAKKMMIISFFAFVPLYLMVTYTGMFASVIYESIPSGGIVPDLIRQISNPFLSATLFVGLSAAIMSTMDSMINTGALSLTIDIYKRYINIDASQEKLVVVGRVTTLIITFVALLIALQIQSVLTISWIASDFLTTGAFVPLVLGFLWVKGTSRAATYSMVFGLLFSSYNLFAALGLPLPIYWEVASAKQAIIGIFLSLLIYVSVSLLERTDMQKAKKFIDRAGMIRNNDTQEVPEHL